MLQLCEQIHGYTVLQCLSGTNTDSRKHVEVYLVQGPGNSKTHRILKRVPSEYYSVDAQFLEREKEALLKLDHTNLPKVIDIYHKDDGVYIITNYIEGSNLLAVLDEVGRFDQKQVWKWAKQLCESLHSIHAAGVVHADIKPSNIMLKPNGEVVLIDFDVSAILSGSISSGGSSSIGGTKAYAAPEQKGEIPSKAGHAWVNCRSDIYSLGLTLYTLLTGLVPGEGALPLEEYPELELSSGLCRIIAKATAYHPRNRFESVEKMSCALTRLYQVDKRYISFQRQGVGLLAIFCVLFGGCIILAYAGYLGMQSGDIAEYQSLLEQGLQAERDLQYSQAYQKYEEAVLLLPDQLSGYAHIGALLYKWGEYNECISFLVDKTNLFSVQSGSRDTAEALAGLYYLLGNCYLEAGNIHSNSVNAERYLKQAVLLRPEDLRYRSDYAIALARIGSLEEAGKVLSDSLRVDSGDFRTLLLQAEIALRNNDTPFALQMYAEALQAASDGAELRRCYLGLARLYEEQDNLDGQIDILLQGRKKLTAEYRLAIDDRLMSALVEKGEITGNAQFYREALEYWKEASRMRPPSLSSTLQGTYLHYLTGNFRQAMDMSKDLMELYPEHYQPYLYYALAAIAQQNLLEVQDRDYSDAIYYAHSAQEYYRHAQANGAEDPNMEWLDTLLQELAIVDKK